MGWPSGLNTNFFAFNGSTLYWVHGGGMDSRLALIRRKPHSRDMAELFKYENFRRVKFQEHKQATFLLQVKERTGQTYKSLARIVGVSARTFTDWKREKFLIPYSALSNLCKAAGLPLPKTIELRDKFWYTSKGSSAGGTAVYKKYGRIGGDPQYRKKKWREWWEREGRLNPPSSITIPIPIKKPRCSESLAEFVGIMLGDGGISPYQIKITLHHKDDYEFGKYVMRLIKKLFDLQASVLHDPRDSVNDYVVSRKELVKFCTKKLGLVIGNKIKQQIDIPPWIKGNRGYEIACVRGLVDTDGSVFTHRYQVGGKWYQYKKLCFSSRSCPLLRSVHSVLQNLGLHPRLTEGLDVRLDSIEDMQLYFRIIGSHNPKHLCRYVKKMIDYSRNRWRSAANGKPAVC